MALTSDDPVDYIDSYVTFHVKELNLPIQYALHDFNEDGINEIMALFDSSIIEIYSLQDQKLVPFFNDPTLAERSHLTLYSTNQIDVRQTSGAAYNYFTLYELNDNGSGVRAIGRMG